MASGGIAVTVGTFLIMLFVWTIVSSTFNDATGLDASPTEAKYASKAVAPAEVAAVEALAARAAFFLVGALGTVVTIGATLVAIARRY